MAVIGGHAELADLASLALQLVPQPHLTAPLALKLADFLGEGGREGRAIELLERRIAAAEGDPAVPAADLLAMLQMLAWHVGEKSGGSGDPKRALEIARRVVRDTTTLYGPAHWKTLDATITLARQVGASGNPRQALTIAREVDASATAAYGAGDWTTLRARFEVAAWTHMADGGAAGAECFAELIRQAERLEAPPQVLIADSMGNLAQCLSESGNHLRAIRASQDAINLTQQLYGARHARVLQTQLTHASVVGSSGDPQAAADLSRQLAEDCTEIIGESHLTTLKSRRAAAYWAAVAGDHAGAARRYEALLTDLARGLSDDHWLTQQCRIELAELKYLSADVPDVGRRQEGALAAIQETDIRRELAAARPDTFRPDLGRALFKMSNRLADLGRREEALAAIKEAADIRRELAAARPDTFRPDLARALFNLSLRLADLGRREEALAAIKEAADIRRELAATRPDAYQRMLEQSLEVAAWLEHGDDHSDAARREPKA